MRCGCFATLRRSVMSCQSSMRSIPMTRQHCGNFGRPLLTRREMLQRAGLGIGTLALTALLAEEGRLEAGDGGLLDASSLKGKAKNVIFLFMGGGPSQVDTFDPKPEL